MTSTMTATRVLVLFVVMSAVVLADAVQKDKRLIEVAPGTSMWATEQEMIVLRQKHVGFIDITDLSTDKLVVPDPPALPNQPKHKPLVRSLLDTIEIDNVKGNLQTFTDFHTRNYKTQEGLDAAHWIHSTASAYTSGRSDIAVTFFNNTFAQPSVMATIKGTSSDVQVVIGAHLDSTNMFGANLRSPGADDDGSGSTLLLEALRVIAQSGFRPNRTICFQWYAAEEAGLRGSAAIAEQYAKDNVNVVGMIQFDMAGYPGSGAGNMGIVTDFVSQNLTQFLREIVEAYSELNFLETRCGYACSDHASWTRNGYRACHPAESKVSDGNPSIHTANDTIDKLSFEHIKELAKIAVGFVVELSFQ